MTDTWKLSQGGVGTRCPSQSTTLQGCGWKLFIPFFPFLEISVKSELRGTVGLSGLGELPFGMQTKMPGAATTTVICHLLRNSSALMTPASTRQLIHQQEENINQWILPRNLLSCHSSPSCLVWRPDWGFRDQLEVSLTLSAALWLNGSRLFPCLGRNFSSLYSKDIPCLPYFLQLTLQWCFLNLYFHLQ